MSVAASCRLAAIACVLATSFTAMGQEREDLAGRRMFGRVVASPSDVATPPQSAKELRVARAQYKAAQRLARLENRLWIGDEPLRPRWNPMPMMTSRYAPIRIQVPVFYTPIR